MEAYSFVGRDTSEWTLWLWGHSEGWGDSGGDSSGIAGFPVGGMVSAFSDTGLALLGPQRQIKIGSENGTLFAHYGLYWENAT